MDRISRLPSGIIETILCFLPIQEAARTSILSTGWRYHWIKIPKLAFSEKTFQVSNDGDELSVLEQTFNIPSKRKEMATRCKLFYAIYQVLLMHEGPIHEFTLSMVADGSCVEIDHILLHLSKKKTVKILKLDFDVSFPVYTLPPSLFSLGQLTELYLSDFALDYQPTSGVFGSLTTLYLGEMRTNEKAFMRLLSSCPLLKRLINKNDGGTIDFEGDSTIVDLFECLPGIEYLSTWFFTFICFTPDKLPKELPTKLVHLKYLYLESVWFRHKYSVPFLVLLIRSSPNLEKLKLEISDTDLFEESETSSFILEDYTDIVLEHLNELEILNFYDESDLLVVKLLLANSPVLKNAKILLWDGLDNDDKLEFSETIPSLPCTSPLVKLVVS